MYEKKAKLHERQRRFKPGDLRTIALDVIPWCNMKCPHCYAVTFVEVDPIELEVLGKALEEAYHLGVFHYVLQGGEPIMAPRRLEAIIGMVHPDETYINIVSNGWSMSRDKVRWLKDLQVDKICLSLDSGIEAKHDAGRMPGSFKRVLRAVDDVLAEGLHCSLSTVVTHQSLYSEDFRKAYEIALSKGIRLDAQIGEPVGLWDGRKDILITPEDAKYIKELKENGPKTADGRSMIHRDIFTGECDHCPAGNEFLGLTADGRVLPCNFLQFSMGNIRERTLSEMREELLTSHWFSGHHPHCLCGEDEEFIDNFIMPYTGMPKPLDAHAVFGLKSSRVSLPVIRADISHC